MTETGYFKSGENQLYYVYEPAGTNAQPYGVLFVHAADSNRLGPHRMFVEAGRRFNQLGYPTFRFDLAGCGDSYGEQSDDIAQAMVDTGNAIRFFQRKFGLAGVIVFGISRGSLIAFNTMLRQDFPIKGLILLSIQITSGKAAIRSFSHYFREYLLKLGDIQTYKKLFKGQINISRVFQTLLLPFRKTKQKNNSLKMTVSSIKTHGPLFFVFGEKDPVANTAKAHYSKFCDEKDIRYECHVIKNANHSFFHYKWKEEIFDLSQTWLGIHFTVTHKGNS